MISSTFSEEFKRDGAEVVREKVARHAYVEDEKHEAAIKWLNRQDPARRTYKAVKKQLKLGKKQLELARRTARETRIALLLCAVTLVVLMLALAKLWHG